MDELSIYSEEPSWNVYTKNLFLENGESNRLLNINRGNNKNKIYVDININGKCYLSIYRGYKLNGVLKYELSNKQLIDGVGTREVYIFQDFTESNQRYINYVIKIEALEHLIYRPYKTGLLFDEILSSSSLKSGFNCNLSNDINSTPLQKQVYEKLVTFNLLINRGYLQQLTNVIEKPFYFINEFGECGLNNNTLRLANRSISTKYVTSHTKYIDVTLTNLEEI